MDNQKQKKSQQRKTTNSEIYYSPKTYKNPLLKTYSVSILRHPNLSYSFSKASRFNYSQLNNKSLFQQLHLNRIMLPNTISKRFTCFGIGQRFSTKINKNHSRIPSPGDYQLRQFPSKQKSVGKTFGLPYSFYKMKEPKSPPVGQYQIRQEPGKSLKKITIKSKIPQKIYIENDKFYDAKYQLLSPCRFSKISFGIGSRNNINFRRQWQQNGPAQYYIKSKFDKTK